MKRLLMVLSLVVLPLAGAAIAAEKSAASKPGAKVEVFELSIHPCQPPRPTLKYSLLPGYLERTPGNAVPVYAKAFVILGDNVTGKKWDEVQKWLDMPLSSLPRGMEDEGVAGYSRLFIGQLDIAARRDRCEWDPPIREAGRDVFGILLPELQSARLAARAVALRARLQILEKKYDRAMASLRTGYGLARHVAEQPLLVAWAVGLSLAGMMDNCLQDMLAQPDAPSLYWAIAAMPKPLIDLRRSMEVEGNALYIMFPEMQPSRRGDLSPEQWSALAPHVLSDVADLAHYFRAVPAATAAEKGEFVAKLMKAAPEAKADLIAAGHPREKVESMPPGQAVLLDMFEIYEARRDDLFKWFNIPYWQAFQGVEEAKARAGSGNSDGLASLAKTLLPVVGSACLVNARAERRRAALCCVEAIRLYAGLHGGKLPATLDEIREVPIPINPLTGKAFPYRVEGEVAILDADGPAPPEVAYPHEQQYRLRVVK